MSSTIFVDLRQRQWSIDLTFGKLRRAKSITGVDLLEPDGQKLQRLLEDDGKIVDLLWELITEQRGDLKREAFEDAINRDVMESALEALIEAIINFSRPERREVLRALLLRIDQTQTEALRLAAEKMTGAQGDQAQRQLIAKASERMDRELELRTEEALNLIGGSSALNGQE